jgi:hypothetical protein
MNFHSFNLSLDDVKKQVLPWSAHPPCDYCSLQPTRTRLRDRYLEGRSSIRLRRRRGVRAVAEGNARDTDGSTLIRSTRKEAPSRFLRPVDRSSAHRRCIFYVDIVRDFISWRPKSSGDAVVLFHATAVEGAAFGVKKFFAELAARHPSIEFHRVYGLGSAQHRTGGARAATRRVARPSPPDSGGVRFPRCRVDGAISASR